MDEVGVNARVGIKVCVGVVVSVAVKVAVGGSSVKVASGVGIPSRVGVNSDCCGAFWVNPATTVSAIAVLKADISDVGLETGVGSALHALLMINNAANMKKIR